MYLTIAKSAHGTRKSGQSVTLLAFRSREETVATGVSVSVYKTQRLICQFANKNIRQRFSEYIPPLNLQVLLLSFIDVKTKQNKKARASSGECIIDRLMFIISLNS